MVCMQTLEGHAALRRDAQHSAVGQTLTGFFAEARSCSEREILSLRGKNFLNELGVVLSI
jgi:hypothetical protein